MPVHELYNEKSQKTAFKATNARRFSIRFVWFVGFGYERFIQPMNSTLFVKEIVNYYLPLCRVRAVQNFARVQKPESGECITRESRYDIHGVNRVTGVKKPGQ